MAGGRVIAALVDARRSVNDMALRRALLARGFCGPLETGLDVQEACEQLRALGGPVQLGGDLRFKPHLLFPALFDLVTAEPVVEAAAEALGLAPGEPLLCRSSDLNIKRRDSSGFYSWHQDGRYAGAEPAMEVVTAWLALTPATLSSGCLRFLPMPLESASMLPHDVSAAKDNMLSRGQTIPARTLLEAVGQPPAQDAATHSTQVREASVAMELQAGQFSLHSFLAPHASGPNQELASDRVGLAVRFMTSRVRCTGATRETALLVRGEAPTGYDAFDLAVERRPAAIAGDDERALHAQAVALENANYFEGNPVRSGYHV